METKTIVDAVIKELAIDPVYRAKFKDAIDAIENTPHLFGVHINGVEVNQAIQYRHADDHLTDPSDRGADNSITLVADKPALVRVYVSTIAFPIDNITGTVTVQRKRYGIWVDSGTLDQQFPGSIISQPSITYAAERGSLFNSLNFIIPARLMHGHMRLKVHVESHGAHVTMDDDFIEISAFLKQTLHVRGIPVQYWGPDNAGNQVKLNAPTLADFQTTSATTVSMYPVSQTPDISLTGTFTWSTPLSGNMANGSCPQSWQNILFWLGIAKAVDGNRTDRLYYALLPNGIPIGDTGGCGGGGGVGTGFINDGMAMAHELGHVFNFPHAPACLPKDDLSFDTNYPAYEPYDTVNNKMASIGEYGLDPTTNTVYSPATTSDFMSYCGSKWISLYHYKLLLENPLLDPVILPGNSNELPPRFTEKFRVPGHIPDPTPPWEARRLFENIAVNPEPLIMITGFIKYDQIEIVSVIRLKTRPALTGKKLEGTVAELLDGNNKIIHRGVVQWMTGQPCGCGCSGHGQGNIDPYGIIQAILPNTEAGSTLRVTRNKEELWVRHASDTPPSINNLAAGVRGEELNVSWHTIAGLEDSLERFVRYSSDDGKNWEMLGIGLKEDKTSAAIANMTPGRILIEVSVSDGFYTSTASTTADIPERPSTVAILWPAEDCTVRTDTALRCWGMATGSNGQPLPDSAMHWELDGQSIGKGKEIWEPLPEWEGEHCLKLSATEGDREYYTSVRFLATGSGRRAYQREGNKC